MPQLPGWPRSGHIVSGAAVRDVTAAGVPEVQPHIRLERVHREPARARLPPRHVQGVLLRGAAVPEDLPRVALPRGRPGESGGAAKGGLRGGRPGEPDHAPHRGCPGSARARARPGGGEGPRRRRPHRRQAAYGRPLPRPGLGQRGCGAIIISDALRGRPGAVEGEPEQGHDARGRRGGGQEGVEDHGDGPPRRSRYGLQGGRLGRGCAGRPAAHTDLCADFAARLDAVSGPHCPPGPAGAVLLRPERCRLQGSQREVQRSPASRRLHRSGECRPQLGRPGGCGPHQRLRRALQHGSARQRALRGGVLKEPTCPVGPPRQGAPGGHLPAPPVDERRGGDRGFRSPAWAERGVPSDGSPRHGAPAGAPHAADAGARARSLPSAGAGRRWGRLGVAGRAEGRGLLPGLERLHDVAGHENAPVALRDVPAERAEDPGRPGA
mmetsp:Transcript_104947/g.282044  ORF Transcript_104947/g.282044 Transcript_104947/m.282044 type:complete len:438 (-) Transcript_104947:848-2161(-)